MEGVFSTSLVICRSLCFAAVVLIFLVSLGGDVARGEDCYSSYAYFRWAMTEECGSHYNSATQTQVFNLGVYSGLQQHVKDLPYHIEEKSFAGSAIATDTVTSEMNKVFQPGDRTLLVVIGMAYYDGVRQDMTTNQMELNSRNVKDYVDIAPFIYGDVFRTWSQMEYYGRAEELMEAVLATRYAVNVLRAKRIFLSGDGLTTTYTQYYTVTNIGSSPKQFKFELTFLRSAGYADGVDTGVCTWSSTSYDSTFVSKNPQVLIMIHTDEGFVTANTKNAKLPNLITISGFYFLGRTLNIIMSVPHAANFAQRLFTTTTSHTAAQVEYQYIQKFRDDYNRTFGPSEHIGLRSPDHMLYSVAGWLQSMLMIEILMDPSWWCTRSNLRNKLFGPQQSRSYTIGGDYRVGGFAGECGQSSNNGGCKCNQGGRTVWMYEVKLVQQTTSAVDYINYTQESTEGLCYYYGNLAPVPLLTSLLRYTSADLAGMSVGEDYMQLLSGLELVPMSNVNASVSLETRTVSLDSSNDAAAVTADLSNYATRVVLGSATTSVDLSSVLQVGVLKPGVDEAEYEKMNIHVTPTIGPTFYNVIGLAVQAKDGPEQAYQYCLPVTFKRVDGGSMPAAAEASRKLWNCPAPTSGVSSDGYGTDHVTLVVGTVGGKGYATTFATLLSDHPKATIVLPFSEFALQYTELVAAFSSLPSDVQRRMVTVTNLPLWTQTSADARAASPLLDEFLKLSNNPAHLTPGHMTVFTAVQLVRAVAPDVKEITAATLAASLWSTRAFDIHGLRLYYNPEACPASPALGAVPCDPQNSIGATDMHYVSMEQVFHPDATAPVLEVMQVRSSTTTKIPELKPHKSSTAEPTTTTTTTTSTTPTSTPVVSGVCWALAGVLLGLLLLLAFLVVWACCYTSASGFEDMEPWRPLTTLVVSYDDVMCNSLSLAGVRVAEKLHERLERVIRKSFVAHGVHEVRSTGSSLYGLSHDCCAALECSREIQRSVASLESSFPLSLGMGLATGLLQGQRDEKTKEMAYFGSSMTLAERIATQLSKGVIVAHGTSWYALSVTEGASIPVSGPHRRRVEDAVSLFDISRRLPEEELYLIDTTNTKAEEWKEEAPVQPHGEESAPRATSMLAAAPPDTAVNHALNLQWCFERLPVIHRIVLLESLLRHWRQPLPVREAYVSDEGYYKALLDALVLAMEK